MRCSPKLMRLTAGSATRSISMRLPGHMAKPCSPQLRWERTSACAGAHAETHGAAQDILDRTRVARGSISAFVELHIEQGPLLEQEGLQLGVVSAIAAPAAVRVQFSGQGGHAGGLLMQDRRAPQRPAPHREEPVAGACCRVPESGLAQAGQAPGSTACSRRLQVLWPL